jgi:ubiquinone/menaquinone biosynthesis C-methylase UbiE
MADSPHHITLLNLEELATRHKNIRSIYGDARHLTKFDDKSFDIVFSNSVIEHVGEYGDQQAMAEEVRRVGMKYFVQTPSYSFPIEPHFLLPGFHWLPKSIRVWLVQHFSFGWYGEKTPDPQKASEIVDSIRLLRKSEMRTLFHDANIFHERFLGLTKSFIAIKG